MIGKGVPWNGMLDDRILEWVDTAKLTEILPWSL